MKILLCISALSVSLIAPGLSFCEQGESTHEMFSREGVVTQVDSIGSLLVISDGIEEARFNVEEGAKIQRGIDDIMLDDLESNDTVNVQYYKAPDGTLKAVSIVDNNIASSF
ncbi:MAG: hypothetical protein PHT50_06000 [Candidatus Omnitrophica bacterium]|nr:hypothetical protein [Candidatus Omnitrophota bacterium]